MKPVFFIWIVLICHVSGAQTISEDTALARQYLEKGNLYLKDNANLDSSGIYFEKAASLYGQHNLWENLFEARNKAGETLRKKGKLDKSEELTQTIINHAREKLGEENLVLISSYNNLGEIYSSRGDYEPAQEYFEKALQIRLKLLGKNHLDVALSYDNLGVNYDFMGQYEKALEYYQMA